MKNGSFLVIVSASTRPADLEPFLRSAGATRAHLSFLILGSLPRVPVFAYGIESYGVASTPDYWREEMEAGRAELRTASRTLEAALDASIASGDVDVLSCEPSALPSVIGRRATTCDAVVVANDLREHETLFHHAVHGSLFNSPTGVVLNGTGDGKALNPGRIFLAWDTSLPAARAAHIALPLLMAAEDVTIGIFDPVTSVERDGHNPGSDIARWLSHHDCNVTVQQYPSGGEEIAKCILGRAAETGAELVVMGAYGHSRLREAVFGGTTRTMIEQRHTPVLLAH